MKKTLLAVPVLALLAGYAAISQTPAGPKHHVVFQMSEPESSWSSLPLHVTNTMNALADDGGSEVEVVFYGPGLGMLTKSSTAYEAPLKKLSDRGVKLLACRNAMKVRRREERRSLPVRRTSRFRNRGNGSQAGSGMGLRALG